MRHGLNRKEYEVLNPTYQTLSRRKDRKKILTRPIFNGYMFIKASLNAHCHLEILKTPGVVEILKSQRGPIPVPDDQVENVRLLEKHVGSCFLGSNLVIGDLVYVTEGPLTGLRGIINRLDNKKLYINVAGIPGSIIIELKKYQVQLEKDKVYSMVIGT